VSERARVARSGPPPQGRDRPRSSATIQGTLGGVPFTLLVHDGGKVGVDTARLLLANGYDTGLLSGQHGNLKVSPKAVRIRLRRRAFRPSRAILDPLWLKMT
jgi:hypothetical protein